MITLGNVVHNQDMPKSRVVSAATPEYEFDIDKHHWVDSIHLGNKSRMVNAPDKGGAPSNVEVRVIEIEGTHQVAYCADLSAPHHSSHAAF
ncbi:hypothetical protein RQP46_004849 [Phenoliferia psychrophenolica]